MPVSVPPFGSSPTAISAGGAHTCALLSGGAVNCWGKNDEGQLGDGTTTNSTSPVLVSGITTATAISAGGSHTCALLSSGKVQCWGENSSGQLGNNNATTTPQTTPVTVVVDDGAGTTTDLSGVSSLSAGGTHTCAMLSTIGQLKCWGENKFGQVGNGERPISKKPIAVPGITDAVAVGAGQRSTCVLQSGTVLCLGDNEFGQLGNGTNLATSTPSSVGGISGATGLTVGRLHACAIVTIAGDLKCWGANGQGQLGDNSGANSTTTSVSVKLADGSGPLLNAKSVSAGQNHTCAVLDNRSVLCWGEGLLGQLGNGDGSDKSLPFVVDGLSSDIVSSGRSHTCSLSSTIGSVGSVLCWGNNDSGQLGAETPDPKSLVPIGPLSTVNGVVLSAGGKHSCAIANLNGDFIVKCWGSNASGQITGVPSDNNPAPNTVFSAGNALIASSSAQSITAGPKHTCVVLPAGTVNCWGDNESGQLGNGTTNATSTPGFVKVSGPNSADLTDVIAIATSGSDEIEEGAHTCAIMSGGTMQCWGDGLFGQIGSAFKAIVEQPTTVEGLF